MNRMAHEHGRLREAREALCGSFIASASRAQANLRMKARDALVRGGPDGLDAWRTKLERIDAAFWLRFERLDAEFFGRRDYATEVRFLEAAE